MLIVGVQAFAVSKNPQTTADTGEALPHLCRNHPHFVSVSGLSVNT